MLFNYIKIAWRNFIRNKSFSFLNVLGLSIGMGCIILILLFVAFELSYDKFHEDKDQLFAIAIETTFGDRKDIMLSTSQPMGRTFREDIPEIIDYVTMLWPGLGEISLDGESFQEEGNILQSTESFFNMFSFPLIIGDPNTVLDDPESAVITESIAKKYFPNKNPIGERIHIKRYGNREFTITGIAADMAKNSYLEFSIITSIKSNQYYVSNEEAWGANMFLTFLKTVENPDWEYINPKFANVLEVKAGDGRFNPPEAFFQVSISDLYLRNDLLFNDGFKGNPNYIYIFSAIGLFILILASINYMNLATAKATIRVTEVGIRKVVGADRSQLIIQFLGESVITALIAFFIGIFIAEFSLPFFNDFLNHELSFNVFKDWKFLLSIFVIALFLGIMSGGYPAFFLSRFTPSQVLKSSKLKLQSGVGFRRILVVTQFSVSIALIICTIIAFNQMRYMLGKNLGFNGEQVLFIQGNRIQNDLDVFKERVLQNSMIVSATLATDVPGKNGMRYGASFDPSQPELSINVAYLRADESYADVFALELAAGRFFDENFSTDASASSVVNEAFVQRLGWTSAEDALGKYLVDSTQVIGVLKNYHFVSLKNDIDPMLIKLRPDPPNQYEQYGLIAVRFIPQEASSVIHFLQTEWDKFNTGYPLKYEFVDEHFANLYETEQKLSYALSVFAGIAIFIGCLGLFGLTTFSVHRRKKEIGIRKVLGASLSNLITLLSREYVLLVCMGFLIATPISWYTMNQWLTDFAYRIEIGAFVFVLAGFAALSIALFTVSWEAIRAALANPVESLKNE